MYQQIGASEEDGSHAMILQYRSILHGRPETSFLFTYEDDGDLVMR